MVHRVKAGELCGTIAGLPWHQKTRREGKRRRRKTEGFSVDWGVWCSGQRGVSVPQSWGKSSEGNYYERRQVKLD